LPKKDPQFPQIEFASYFRSASETGGDWFAYSMQPNGKTLSVIIADVTGHGLPAALLTEAAHSCFTTINTFKDSLGPSEVLRMLNQVLIPQMDHQYGMTAFVSNVELETLHMTFANAGHNMPLVYRGHNGVGTRETFKPLLARGPRLGDSPGDRFEEKEIQLNAHALLFWYTDGLLDCVNPEGECFGKRRVLAVLRENREKSSPMIRDSLISEMMRFTGGMIPPDDVTFIIGKVL
jgi:serine phosphatase RsbU (regulator of sigma subunit)